MSRLKKLTLIATSCAAGAAVFIWGGLQVKPDPFPAPPISTELLPATTLPSRLPAPVERFYQTLYGADIPIIEGAVISGTGTMRISGITLPVRFRFTHIAGQDYRHVIEATLFSRRIISVNEIFIAGTARLDLPFGESSGSRIDQAPILPYGQNRSGCPRSG